MYVSHSRTGRENRMIYYHSCGHREPPKGYPVTETGSYQFRCTACGGFGMHFVAYEDGIENEAAERVLSHVLPVLCHQRK